MGLQTMLEAWKFLFLLFYYIVSIPDYSNKSSQAEGFSAIVGNKNKMI
jgi:hypothetical protein